MSTAIAEFGAAGYAGGTVNRICKSGISKGLIYHNFPDKDALYLACLQHCCAAFVAHIRRMGGTSGFQTYMQARMDFLPVPICGGVGLPADMLLRRIKKGAPTLAVMLCGITLTMLIGWLCNTFLLSGITLNYMLMGVAFSAVFANLVTPERLKDITTVFSPILSVYLLAAIVDLGAPLNFRLILGAGLYTFVYIFFRAFGKYFGARIGAGATHMPDTVRKYLGLTLLPHSGVSLVFTGIICSTLSAAPPLVQIVQGTIAAAAVINEIIAVIAAKKGFELAGEIQKR